MACESRDEAAAAGKNTNPQAFEENALSEVRHVIGVVSGKGGVGKSFVSVALAAGLQKAGATVGILDADITGPSIPYLLGLRGQRLMSLGDLYLPSIAPCGIKVMSSNLLLGREDDPVLWRGPVLAGALRQFWSQTSWGPLDYLIIDMPPGTGDVALTCYQSLPMDGVVIVSSPQDIVSMIVTKAVKMAARMDIGVLGIVENLSYLVSPTDGAEIDLFGPSHLKRDAELCGVDALDRLPIEPALAEACDQGRLADALPDDYLPGTVARALMLEAVPAPVPDLAAMDARLDAYRDSLGLVDGVPEGMEERDATPDEEPF
ncbi:P-loop NTPase [Olsenella sp. YH-ols2217]|uniref:Iron-sulfur cluster carrier protein n=1 Tax=Kribbibacterium absianum TaxID=3044210 RepID=A0ABT6ZMC5_9ACTN|nr:MULTISPECIES: P-loop NTPase [unclassified Olsenella]MDJ1122196.1 P-loop NTPase [Olsenella sp. YH-ols2216]MDJ1130204.1 P-loop NTPase [Olsenella sp. YH-ols2217]